MKFTNSIRTSMCIAVLTLLLAISSFAQAPEKMSYQAVIRDAENALVTSQQLGMQISILQGDVAVYEETQTPTSNTNGLVSLEIGEGTVISGSFTAIDWSADTSFIKIETDPAGGTNYTITGTSQLLSVPYALYAKTSSDSSAVAENSDKVSYSDTAAAAVALNTAKTVITSDQSDAITANSDKVSYSDAAAAAVALNTAKTVITSDQSDAITANSDKVSYSDAAAAAVALNTAKTVITSDQSDAITANTDKVSYSDAAAAAIALNTAKVGATAHAIGDTYGGGIIFWLDSSGQHGLIAATEDQNTGTGIQWYNGTHTVTNAVRDGIGAGKINTERIIANQGSGTYAAQICANYQGGNYGDWYLPSKYELNLMREKKTEIGGVFQGNYFWSSTEGDDNNAWFQSFEFGNQINANKNITYSSVRAVRAF